MSKCNCIHAIDGYETYFIDENTIGVRPFWRSVKEKPLHGQKVLAVFISDPKKYYNCRADGWFRDTIYACRYVDDEYIIESHGPTFAPTHWMPLPNPPEKS